MPLTKTKFKALEAEVASGTMSADVLRECLLEKFGGRRGEQDRFHKETGIARSTVCKFLQGHNLGGEHRTKVLAALGYRIRLEELPPKGQR